MDQTTISNLDDIIDVRDLTERVEELRDELTERHETGGFASSFDDWIANSRDNSDPVHAAFPDDGAEVQEAIEEYYKLNELLEELAGRGGDHQWEGAWYPLVLVRDSHFESYAQELAEDCGLVKHDQGWPNDHIDWEAAAHALQMDYSSIEFDGISYWYR